MDKVVVSRVEMAVISTTGSTERETKNVAQNLDKSDFSKIMEKTPHLTASSRTTLNINQDGNGETCKNESFDNAVDLEFCPGNAHLSHVDRT